MTTNEKEKSLTAVQNEKTLNANKSEKNLNTDKSEKNLNTNKSEKNLNVNQNEKTLAGNQKEKILSDPTKRSTLKKVLRRIRPYWGFLLVSLILSVITSALTLYIPILIGHAIDAFAEQGNVDFEAVFQILVWAAAAVGVTSVGQWIMNVMNNHVTYHIVHDIREEAFQKIEILPLKYLDRHAHGEIVSQVIADVDQFADGLLMGFTQFFTGIVTILGTLLFMLTIQVKITFAVVLLTPLSFVIASFVAKNTYSMFQQQSIVRGQQTAFIDEMIGNEKVVQAFGYGDRALKRFDELNTQLENCSLRATFFSSLTNPATRFVNNVVYAVVALIGAFTVLGGAMTVGNLTSFLSYANQYTKPFNEISGVITELQNALACAARIFRLIEEEPQTPEAEDARVLEDAKGNVELKQVKFSYDPQKPLIESLNLSVKPGQRVALVGPTGCGKTTIINLLMRFYDVEAGTISVDGTDIRMYTRNSLRTNYGMVLQETWLKAGTIRENIGMGKPDASEEEIIAAAKASHAHSFIRRLPQGYDTVITEDGGMLSQGQKQLLCIARVMLCLPPMLILDEATSSIDTRTELKIQETFARMMKGRTSFIAAHRLSTIQNADVILVMKDGHIIEQGNHEELLAKDGFYRNLYQSQFQI